MCLLLHAPWALGQGPSSADATAAVRAASSCERSLTNAAQALQLLDDAIAECQRLRRTPGTTALARDKITCWSDLDVAADELRAAQVPFLQLRQGGSAAQVRLHSANASRFLERARQCISAQVIVATRPDVAAPPVEEGPRSGSEWAQGGVTVIKPGGRRGVRQNHANDCISSEDGVLCPGGRAGQERLVPCRRDYDGKWPDECPTVFQAQADRQAHQSDDRCQFNPQLTECQGRPKPPKPPPRPPLEAKVERICDMRKLAAYTFGGYYDARPVARLRITNGASPNTYLILMSGMQPRLAGSTNLADATTALFNIQGMDSYRLAVMDALEGVPPGSTLVLAGHSQGGMEAQNMVANLVERWGYKVPQVITFGAPVSAWKQGGTSYLHLRERRDPVPAMDQKYDLTSVKLFDAGPGVSTNPWDPNGAHLVYDKLTSGLQNMPLPPVPGLTTPCIEVDLSTLVRKAAPNYFTRLFTRPENGKFAGSRPRNPDWGPLPEPVNCLWVSLAQDRFWREGLPYYAMCETRPVTPGELEAVLSRQFGGLNLDDGLGPTPQDAIHRHSNGWIVLTTRTEMERALLKVGTQADGRIVSTGGLVFVHQPGRPNGHIFNVRLKVNGSIEYVDAQTVVDPRSHFPPGTVVRYYRTF